jgi:signal transduction histidine kinase
VALRGEASEVRVEVTNSGLAIDPSALSQLFDPLKRGAGYGDSHDAWGGLGLGLFIVREIAKAHGGEVEARSDDGETTFAVRLLRPHRAASA